MNVMFMVIRVIDSDCRLVLVTWFRLSLKFSVMIDYCSICLEVNWMFGCSCVGRFMVLVMMMFSMMLIIGLLIRVKCCFSVKVVVVMSKVSSRLGRCVVRVGVVVGVVVVVLEVGVGWGVEVIGRFYGRDWGIIVWKYY